MPTKYPITLCCSKITLKYDKDDFKLNDKNELSLVGGGTPGDSLWVINGDVIQPKNNRVISANNQVISNVNTPINDKDVTTKKYVDDLGNTKQCKLTAGSNITINDSTCTISATGGSEAQFTPEEAKRLKLVLSQSAFAYNKNAPGTPLEHVGWFSEITVFSDLDEPNDNIVTDDQGNPLDIRKVNFAHYSGNAWYGEDGKTISLRDYQNKLTYFGKELALKEYVDTKQDKLTFSQPLVITSNNVSLSINTNHFGLGSSNELISKITNTDIIPLTIISTNNYAGLNTTNKSIIGAINEISQTLTNTWSVVGSSTNARTWTATLVSGKRYRVSYHWEAPATLGLIYKEFIWQGASLSLEHYQSNVGLLTLLAEILQLQATSSGINISVFQTGNITGRGRILNLEVHN